MKHRASKAVDKSKTAELLSSGNQALVVKEESSLSPAYIT